MLNKIAFIAFVALAVLLIGCISTSDMMASWVGADESALTAAWGEPDSIIPGEPDGRIFVYVKPDAY